MALDVYGKEDILNVLRALHVSSEVPAALSVELLQDRDLPDRGEPAGCVTRDQECILSYQKGFRSALASVALAFGLVPLSSTAPAPSSSSTSQRHELDLRSLVESMVRSDP
jgi:hypothetical protein